ncbi:MAG: ornithine cyclodeaminase [Rhodobacterales bacterium]|nr:MAG: ornithine cyclodeaminase [Rhodobacterales bacterium]
MISPSELAYVPFVSVENMMRLIHSVGIEQMLRELADAIEADFLRWESFDKTARIPAHSDEGVVELMPTADGEMYGFKYVNGHPVNTKAGLQTVTAFGVLANLRTGYPLMLSEMTVLTAMRTAAMSALAAKHLAPKNAEVMAMIGNGAQSEFQCRAFHAICGVRTVRLYDIDPEATRKCARNLEGSGLVVVPCRSSEEAMEGAQIVTTCTADKANNHILTGNMVGAGVHINAIGGDSPGKTELDAEIVKRSDVFVEYPPQTRIEGEIQQLPEDHPVTELWEVFSGTKPGRGSDPHQITLFDSVGFAIEDFSALRYVHDKIKGTDFYEDLDMLADPDDPRDLYGMLQRAV